MESGKQIRSKPNLAGPPPAVGVAVVAANPAVSAAAAAAPVAPVAAVAAAVAAAAAVAPAVLEVNLMMKRK